MKSLDRKLLRDLTSMRAQALTIALVVGAGITAFVSMQSTWRSVRESRRELPLGLFYGNRDVIADQASIKQTESTLKRFNLASKCFTGEAPALQLTAAPALAKEIARWIDAQTAHGAER